MFFFNGSKKYLFICMFSIIYSTDYKIFNYYLAKPNYVHVLERHDTYIKVYSIYNPLTFTSSISTSPAPSYTNHSINFWSLQQLSYLHQYFSLLQTTNTVYCSYDHVILYVCVCVMSVVNTKQAQSLSVDYYKWLEHECVENTYEKYN